MAKQEFLLGRGVEGPFKIEAEGVSKRHALVTITTDDATGATQWEIKDLDSTNGTFIRDEATGEMRRVSEDKITPETFIRLGPQDVRGITFYACHLLSPDNYDTEFNILGGIVSRFRKELDREETKTQMRNLVTPILYLFVIIVSFMPFEKFGITGNGDSAKAEAWLLRVPMMLGGLIGFLLAMYNKKKVITKRYESMRCCPNPGCNHTLSEAEIEMRQCSRCKAH